jgi:hypothetical protein
MLVFDTNGLIEPDVLPDTEIEGQFDALLETIGVFDGV